MTRRIGLAFGPAAAVWVLDQITKAWVVAALADHPLVLIPGFLRFVYFENRGSAFSFFQGAGPLLAIVGVGVVVMIAWTVRGVSHVAELVGLGLVMGGALGNLTDRLTRGTGALNGPVVDWISVGTFPVFNVADAAITVGVALLVWRSWRA